MAKDNMNQFQRNYVGGLERLTGQIYERARKGEEEHLKSSFEVLGCMVPVGDNVNGISGLSRAYQETLESDLGQRLAGFKLKGVIDGYSLSIEERGNSNGKNGSISAYSEKLIPTERVIKEGMPPEESMQMLGFELGYRAGVSDYGERSNNQMEAPKPIKSYTSPGKARPYEKKEKKPEQRDPDIPEPGKIVIDHLPVEPKKKRGRPKGSKNKKKKD